MRIRSVIVDDEELARENLKMLLKESCPEIKVVGAAGSVNEGRQLIKSKQPEVVFLDIKMPSGTEGFDLLDSIPSKNFQVIFVTAFEDYAIKALNSNAIYYILKPIDVDDLRIAINKLVASKQSFKTNPDSFVDYLHSLETLSRRIKESSSPQRIVISHTKGFKIVDDTDILRLEASGNCTKIFFKDQRKYLDTRTLKIYEELLDQRKFFRTHKSHIINLTCLKEYINEDGHFAILEDSSRIPVARNRLAEFIKIAKGLS